MNGKIKKLFADFEFNGAENFSLSEINGVKLSEDYLAFVEENGGGEGALGEEGYLQLWSLSELAENNELYEAVKYLPDCALIATDLSGALFGVTKNGEYFAADNECYMSDGEIEIMCRSFEEFIEKIGRGDYF